ncbi:hypothetical protein CPT34_01275 [Rhizobium sophoriradicis]|uniref:Uncharacterized protein n=1 Tax=Rhizobium sophoriradicis TaxID=1535245 RepID=A0A2A5L101_9HYPH|nr:hypothetical protein CPT34_01275 [Rhizobium sophoriradicis]
MRRDQLVPFRGLLTLGSCKALTSPPSFLCLSQESSVPKSLGTGELLRQIESFTAPTRRGWIPVTSTGMRAEGGMPPPAKGPFAHDDCPIHHRLHPRRRPLRQIAIRRIPRRFDRP